MRRPSRIRPHQLAVKDASQLTLPFLVEAAVNLSAASNGRADAVPASCPEPSSPKTIEPQDPNANRFREPKRKETRDKRKPPTGASVSPGPKLLVSRREAAGIVSLSIRSIDNLLASKQLPFRKIGTRTLIPIEELQRFAGKDHPKRMAS